MITSKFMRSILEDSTGTGWKEKAKASPSLTTLNRELSAISFTYAQLIALIGAINLKYLFTKVKTLDSLQKTSIGKEFTQEERNQLRTALGMAEAIGSQERMNGEM
ncbi:hypothetical protein KIN20_038005 [Parelaphostrongylus tenuis]|uniref:Uncharacterized protein n=1 Tax=Parelaphostrongylus tenuis TaxID=148309 RepID=A0AAD5REX5_PARTN|nr:hypothetical protein KIN20_038005 [Parelaphostrongylus tenuis]